MVGSINSDFVVVVSFVCSSTTHTPKKDKPRTAYRTQATMRFLLPTTLTALISPLLAQTITPAPTSTSTAAWYETGPPWASDDPAKWSSIYSSLLSDGKIPSTLTAAPWPTGSWGPGQGPWGGPGFGPGHGPGGGPGGRWGGTFLLPPLFPSFKMLLLSPQKIEGRKKKKS